MKIVYFENLKKAFIKAGEDSTSILIYLLSIMLGLILGFGILALFTFLIQLAFKLIFGLSVSFWAMFGIIFIIQIIYSQIKGEKKS